MRASPWHVFVYCLKHEFVRMVVAIGGFAIREYDVDKDIFVWSYKGHSCPAKSVAEMEPQARQLWGWSLLHHSYLQ